MKRKWIWNSSSLSWKSKSSIIWKVGKRFQKRKLREDYNPQITQVNQEILEFKTRRADLEIQLVSTGVDVGPAIYLARTFGTDIDTVVKFFIFILIFVFDPLAVMLVIAYNQALMNRTTRDEDEAPAGGSINIESASAKTQHDHWKDIYSSADEERMDIIGQNGNDGLHYDLVEPDDNNPNPYGDDDYANEDDWGNDEHLEGGQMGHRLAAVVVELVEGKRPARVRLGVLGRDVDVAGPADEGKKLSSTIFANVAYSGESPHSVQRRKPDPQLPTYVP